MKLVPLKKVQRWKTEKDAVTLAPAVKNWQIFTTFDKILAPLIRFQLPRSYCAGALQ
ncbi:MAG: hypothetical protein ACTSRS_07650 [Candidatus Helarchaeota archaeon]